MLHVAVAIHSWTNLTQCSSEMDQQFGSTFTYPVPYVGSHKGLGASGAIPIECWSLLVMAIPVAASLDVGGFRLVAGCSTVVVCVASGVMVW